MCFSSEASFVAGAALVACSGLTIRLAVRKGVRYLPLACLPLFFGLQQISEGFLWVSINTPDASQSVAAALVFLFFAYWFWPFWVPLSAALIEPSLRRRRFFQVICGLGFGLGMFLYLPVLWAPDTLDIELSKHSIQYNNVRMFPTETTKIIARLLYALVICIPLVGSSDKGVRGFGYLIVASVAAGFLFASYAFTSIWCFFAAILSVYILYVLRYGKPEADQWAGTAKG